MSLSGPKINPPAPSPAPAAQGADALQLGGQSDSLLNDRGLIGLGRLKLQAPAPGTSVASGAASAPAPLSASVGVASGSPAAGSPNTSSMGSLKLNRADIANITSRL